MPKPQQHDLENRLLASLSPDDFALLAGLLVRMECPGGIVISEPGQPIPYILFPEVGVISVVVETPDGRLTEGGIIGREGFVTSAILMGADRIPHRLEYRWKASATVSKRLIS